MSLVKCKACGGMVSKQAEVCPHCGNPMKRKRAGCGTLIVVVGLALVVAMVWEGNQLDTGTSAPGRPAQADRPAPAPPTPAELWSVTTERSALDDSTNVFMGMQSQELVRDRFGRQHRVTLHLRCQENRTALVVGWGEYMGLRETRVTTRVDSAEARTEAWSISTNNQSTFHPDAIAHIRELMAADTVLYQVTPYGENPRRVTFDLAGLSDAIGPLREACGW